MWRVQMNSKQKSVPRSIGKGLSVVRDFLLGLMSLVCLALGITMVVVDRLPAAGVLFTAGLLLCIFSSLSRFESIKGLGIEAKMAALDNKLNEADELLAHIRNSVGLMADISFQTMAKIGFWDSNIPKREAIAFADAFRKQLTELGETDADINRRMAPWHESNIRMLATPIYQAIHDFMQIQNQDLTKKANSFPLPIDPTNSDWIHISDFIGRNGAFMTDINVRWENTVRDFGDGVETLIQSAPSGTEQEKIELGNKVKPLIEDMNFYVTHKDFQNREKWIKTPY